MQHHRLCNKSNVVLHARFVVGADPYHEEKRTAQTRRGDSKVARSNGYRKRHGELKVNGIEIVGTGVPDGPKTIKFS